VKPWYIKDVRKEIDSLMMPIVSLLNKKGISTTHCCQGHPSEDIDLRAYIRIEYSLKNEKRFMKWIKKQRYIPIKSYDDYTAYKLYDNFAITIEIEKNKCINIVIEPWNKNKKDFPIFIKPSFEQQKPGSYVEVHSDKEWNIILKKALSKLKNNMRYL